jgi:hypothetical protein
MNPVCGPGTGRFGVSTQARQVGRDTPRFGGPAGPLRLGLKADTYTQRAIPGSDLFCQGNDITVYAFVSLS